MNTVNKSALGLFGLTAACAACCAIPVALPLIAGLGIGGGLGTAALGWEAGIGLLLAGSALGLVMMRRRAAASTACSTDGSCGCGPKGITNTLAAARRME